MDSARRIDAVDLDRRRFFRVASSCAIAAVSVVVLGSASTQAAAARAYVYRPPRYRPPRMPRPRARENRVNRFFRWLSRKNQEGFGPFRGTRYRRSR